jgi:hypothetical protein
MCADRDKDLRGVAITWIERCGIDGGHIAGPGDSVAAAATRMTVF